MPQMTVHPPKLHNGQLQVWRSPARFNVLACGRRWGKTRLGAVRTLKTASDGGRAWWVAPSYPMAQVGWRLIHSLVMQIPGSKVNQVDRLATLPGGGTVQVKSADNPDSLRGDGLDFLVLDECAFIREEAWTEALRPALADRQGGVYFISTPKGHNFFWRAWLKGQEGGDWQSWQFPTAANPYIQPSEIEAARETLPERVFEQEFLAMFTDDAGGVFRRVLEAATATAQDGPVEGHAYTIGVDWGKSNDFTVLCVMDETDKALAKLDRFNRIDYAVQVGRLKALCETFKPRQVIAEQNAMGDPLVETLQRDGLPVKPFVTTHATKTTAIDALALAFERGDLRILPDAVLVGELQAFEMERLPSGTFRYSAPSGMHDDTVMALALAWQGCAQRSWYVW